MRYLVRSTDGRDNLVEADFFTSEPSGIIFWAARTENDRLRTTPVAFVGYVNLLSVREDTNEDDVLSSR